ncbi:MAG: glycosyltransferase family 2 protein [Candidatus Doudnabacteria bacterium]|nr:glycosyltransferase family 2 protein [Candidatus Doudnabacteria bacterium]
MDLSIIIVNYNTKDLTRKCLASVFASSTNFVFEVLVSDNGSSDGSIEMIRSEFPQVRLLENNANLGFSKGNNVAIEQAQGQLVLLLNTDTEVRSNTLELSVRYMYAHPDVGIMGCKVLLPNGRLHEASRRRFPNPANAFLRLFGLAKFSNYNYRNVSVDEEMEVDSVVGAFLMIKKEVIDKIGLLDEEFFMYGEDLDWCWRAKEAGFKVMYYPAAEITHYLYGSSKAVAFRSVRWAYDAMKIFYRKHYAASHNFLFNQMVYLGITLRMYLVLILNMFRAGKSVH